MPAIFLHADPERTQTKTMPALKSTNPSGRPSSSVVAPACLQHAREAAAEEDCSSVFMPDPGGDQAIFYEVVDDDLETMDNGPALEKDTDPTVHRF